VDSGTTAAAAEAGQRAAAADRREALRDIAPVAVAAVPIGLVFGALCVGKGLSILEAGLMSVLVFAGGAQFAAVELWSYPVPVLALAFSALLINARHVLMGASLAPKLRGFSRLQQLGGMHFLTDETWALAERRALTRPVTPPYWFIMAVMLPLAWISATFLGAWLGSFLGDQRRLGADFVFTALFIGLVVAFWRGYVAGFATQPTHAASARSFGAVVLGLMVRFWRGRVIGFAVAASGAASALAYVGLGPPWHVGAGAFAGIAAAWLAAAPESRRQS
jgi:4-azaleucine resistance transporter AzlC